ncbi:MAG: MBL fold metallo-hydrolase, partial [Acidobacteriaceae bacterium]
MSNLIVPGNPAANIFHPAEKLGDRFLNPVPTVVMRPGSASRMIRRLLVEKKVGDPKLPLGPFPTDTAVYSRPPAGGLRVTWMGHSTLLIEIDGYRILTDPVWSERASFVSFAGPKRFYPPPLALKDLPPLDAVLISHDHYDHLDRATIRQLAAVPSRERVLWMCSVGVARYLESWGVSPTWITELNWGQTASLNEDLLITATPARH